MRAVRMVRCRGMRRLDPLTVPALWPSWLNPRRIALGGAVLLFIDMVLPPWLTPAGLALGAAAMRAAMGLDYMRGLAWCVLPAVLMGLWCAGAAMRARSAARAALGCLAAGFVFSALTLAGGLVLLSSGSSMPLNERVVEMMIQSMLPGQVLAFTLSLLGLTLPVSRSHRAPSCDAVHEALIVTGAWLLAAGTLVRWNGLALTVAAHLTLAAPAQWSLLCSLAGLAMLVTGLLADRRLLVWVRAVRAGAQPGWRVEPSAGRDAEVPSLLGARSTVEMDGLVMLDGDGGPRPVAWVFFEGDDQRWLVGARARAVMVAVLLLVAVVPAVLLGLASLMLGMPR